MSSEPTIASKVFDAQRKYREAHGVLDDAVLRIFGYDESNPDEWGKVTIENWSIEQDSAYDNSIEIKLECGRKATDAERAALLALGFSLVWNDDHSATGDGDTISMKEYMRLKTELAKHAH